MLSEERSDEFHVFPETRRNYLKADIQRRRGKVPRYFRGKGEYRANGEEGLNGKGEERTKI